jgi:integrase
MGIMTNIAAETLPLADGLRRDNLTVQRWLRDKAEKTQINYLANMITFTQRSGMSPDGFLAWAKTVDPVEVQDQIEKMSEGLYDSVKFNFKIDMRSFLSHNGYNTLPKAKLSYTLKEWHRGYKKEEVRKLLSFLDNLPHKLYVLIAVETGLRANTILALQYRHIAEDFEANIVPCAIRLEPKFYGRKKSAGYTFLGERSLAVLRDAIKAGIVKTKPDSPLVPLGYYGIYDALGRARQKAGLDTKIQPNHGLRKYFEDALDAGRIDKDKKAMIEGHFAGTRAKHYTDREWKDLRALYLEAYPYIDVESNDPDLEKEIAGWQAERVKLEGENRQLKELLSNAEQKFDREIKALRELVEQRTGQKKR